MEHDWELIEAVPDTFDLYRCKRCLKKVKCVFGVLRPPDWERPKPPPGECEGVLLDELVSKADAARVRAMFQTFDELRAIGASIGPMLHDEVLITIPAARQDEARVILARGLTAAAPPLPPAGLHIPELKGPPWDPDCTNCGEPYMVHSGESASGPHCAGYFEGYSHFGGMGEYELAKHRGLARGRAPSREPSPPLERTEAIVTALRGGRPPKKISWRFNRWEVWEVFPEGPLYILVSHKGEPSLRLDLERGGSVIRTEWDGIRPERGELWKPCAGCSAPARVACLGMKRRT